MAITPVDLSVTNITATSVRLNWVDALQALINSLFSAGEQGALYMPRPVVLGAQSLFQDAAGTVPVTADGDPDGLTIDQSPNSINASQSTSAARPTYNANPDRLSLDKVDDALIITVPTGGWNGTMVLATDDGTASYGISIPAGAYELGGQYFPGTAIVGALFRDGALTAGEKTGAEGYFVGNGATASYGAITNFSRYWQGRQEITEFPLVDTSNGTTFFEAWFQCVKLVSFSLIDTSSAESLRDAWRECFKLAIFPLIDTSSVSNFRQAWQSTLIADFPLLDTSSGTNFYATWNACGSLTTFPATFFDNIKGGNLSLAFSNTNLNEASIDGILVSLVASGIATGTRTFDQSGGSAPSVGTGQPAIDTLRSRGWAVTVTGGY